MDGDRRQDTVAFPAAAGEARSGQLDRMHMGSSSAHATFHWLCVGPLDLEALRAAWYDAVLRREPLCATLAERSTDVDQIVLRPDMALFDVERAASSGSVDEREDDRVLAWFEQLRSRPFDLIRGPLARARVLVLEPHRHCLTIAVHQAISDAFSEAALVRDLVAAYEVRLLGRSPEWSPLAESYFERARGERSGGGTQAELLGEVLARIDGAPTVLELPFDRRRPAIEESGSVSNAVVIGRDLVDRLTALTRRVGVQPSVPYLAAIALVVRGWSGEDDFLLGLPVSSGDSASGPVVGCFTNLAVVRVELRGAPNTPELLTRLDRALEAALAQASVPMDELLAAARLPMDSSRPPLVQIAVDFATASNAVGSADGLSLHRISERFGRAVTDLDVNIRRCLDSDGDSTMRVTGKAALFDQCTVNRFGEHCVHVLEQIAAHDDLSIARIELMRSAEAQIVASYGRGPEPSVERPFDVPDLIDRVASEHPTALALVGPDESRWTYRELDVCVAARAEELRSLGVGPGRLVGVHVDQPFEAIVAVLATWRAGGAYVPLPVDAEYRAAMIMAEAAPIAVVSGSSVEPVPSEPRLARPDLAAVIYTSGSTGLPKGVCVTRGSLAASNAARLQLYGTAPETIVFGYSLVFDAALVPLLWTLTTGGTLIVPPLERRADPRLLGTLAEAHGVTAFNLLPSVWAAVLEYVGPARLATLRMVVVGGESCTPSLVRRHFATLPACRLINEYGPTEATVFATTHECRPEDSHRETIPIGRPIPGYGVVVLDPVGQPTPIGVPGELVISGPGVTAGYLDRPELTGDRFRAHPGPWTDEHAASEPGSTAYWSGDRARFLADGSVEFLGRVDRQLKVSGHRIEPGEIEAVLLEHPAVKAVVVGLAPSGDSERLVAHVECAGGLDSATLAGHVGSRLPAALVPGTFVFHLSLPRTPSGKVDPAILATPLDSVETETIVDGDANGARTKAVTNTEQRLALMFEEVLGRPVGAAVEFFSAGGTSILSLRLFAHIERELGIDLPLATLYRAPTIEKLARVIDELGPPDWRSLVLLSQPSAGRYDGAPDGRAPDCGPIVFVHGLGGNITGFASLARRLGVDHVCYAMQSGGLDGRGIPYGSVDELAAQAAAEIARTVPPGPCVIVGLSFGGVVSCEIALDLVGRGYRPRIVMLDATAPGNPTLPETLRGRLLEEARRLQFRFQLLAGRPIALMRRKQYIFLAHARLFERHPVRTFHLPLTLLHTDDLPEDDQNGWRSVAAAGLELYRVPGDHSSFLTEPLVAETAQIVSQVIDQGRARLRVEPLARP